MSPRRSFDDPSDPGSKPPLDVGIAGRPQGLFTPIRIGGLMLANRVVVAPMSRVSTRGDGVPTPQMGAYYAQFAEGGFGLIVTEGTYIDQAHSQAYVNQPALVTAEQLDAWHGVTQRVHAARGRIFLQLMHAGALVQGNQHRDVGIAPSSVLPRGRMMGRGYGGTGPFPRPRAMTGGDIVQVVEAFANTAVRARAAGFDGVEVHAANGYLLDQFITGYTNHRSDHYGGSVRNRIRLTVEVIRTIKQAAGSDLPVGVRLSQAKVNDPDHRWAGLAEAEAILAHVGRTQPAYVHIASENLPWREGTELLPGVTVTGLARDVTETPVIANGQLDDPDTARHVVTEGHADLVALGRGALANPDWPLRVRAGRPARPYEPGLLLPEVTLENSRRWWAARRGSAAPSTGGHDLALDDA